MSAVVPLLHMYAMPPEAFSTVDGVVHVTATSGPALAGGFVLFTLTTTESIDLHPLAPVTVTL